MEFGGDPLSWLLAPESSEVFLNEYFNKRHFLAKNETSNRFGTLLSFEELDHIVGTYGLKFPEIRLARSDQDVPRGEYTYRGDIADPLRIARLFSEGATVIFRGLQDRHKNIQLLCSALAKQATIQTQANIYLTPPNSQGFNIHWDTHDVFILQIEGSKIWRIYDGGISLPIRSQKFSSEQYAPGDLLDEFILEAGDVLYIPRGVMHAAASTEQTSLHITLGLLGYSWAEFIIDVLAEYAEKQVNWRQNLPFGYGNDQSQGVQRIKAELIDRVEAFIEHMEIAPVIHAHLWQVNAASRPRESHFLYDALHAREISVSETVEPLPGLALNLVVHADKVYLSGGAREISFPRAAASTLEKLLEGYPLCIESIEDGLDLESRKIVIARLLREGIVRRSR